MGGKTPDATRASNPYRPTSVVRTADRVSYTFECAFEISNKGLREQKEADTLTNRPITAPSNPKPPKKASILGIPQELRDMISEYVFTNVIELSKDKKYPNKWQRSNLGLVQSCRQLYSETREMYYKSNTFKAEFSLDVIGFLRDKNDRDGLAWYLPLVREIRFWDFTAYVTDDGKRERLRRQRESFYRIWGFGLRPGVLRMARKTGGGEIVWDVVESDSSA